MSTLLANPFQRQEELKNWNQPIITNLKCLVLGVGGLGFNISADLCRLGVKSIVLLDMDTVDTHNLNRQILYRAEHVGRPKVVCAKEELERHHVLNEINIQIHNVNALEHWQVTIQLIKECDVIFNTIDHGDYFDYVVCSLAHKYGKPLVLGGTDPHYGHSVSYFLQGIREADPKYSDCHDLKNPNEVTQLELIESYDNIMYLPKDVHPVLGGSTVYSAGTCSHLMVCAVTNYLFHLVDSDRPDPPKQMLFNLMTMESTRWFSSNIDGVMCYTK